MFFEILKPKQIKQMRMPIKHVFYLWNAEFWALAAFLKYFSREKAYASLCCSRGLRKVILPKKSPTNELPSFLTSEQAFADSQYGFLEMLNQPNSNHRISTRQLRITATRRNHSSIQKRQYLTCFFEYKQRVKLKSQDKLIQSKKHIQSINSTNITLIDRSSLLGFERNKILLLKSSSKMAQRRVEGKAARLGMASLSLLTFFDMNSGH